MVLSSSSVPRTGHVSKGLNQSDIKYIAISTLFVCRVENQSFEMYNSTVGLTLGSLLRAFDRETTRLFLVG